MNRTDKYGITGSTLKIIACISMLIDHTGAAVLRPLRTSLLTVNPAAAQLCSTLYPISRSIGRLAFPIFCFLLVEGYLHTRNAKKYALRLFLFSLISELPFDYALSTDLWNWKHQNVYFTLLIGLLVMMGISYFDYKPAKTKWHRYFYFLCEIAVAAGGLFLAKYIYCDYRYKGVFLIEVLYFLRADKKLQAIFGALAISWEATGPLAFIPIWFYNGKRGISLKYFFYWFYPVHLIILGLIRHYLI